MLTSIVKIILFSLFLLVTESNVFLYFIVGFLLLSIPSRYFTKLNRKYSHISYESSIDISENVERVIDNLYLIKILNKFTDEKELFKNNLNNYYDAQINNQKYGTLNSLFPTFSNDDDFVDFDVAFPNFFNCNSRIYCNHPKTFFQSLGEFNRVLSMSISTYVHLENLLKIEENKETYSSNFQIEDSIKERKNAVEI